MEKVSNKIYQTALAIIFCIKKAGHFFKFQIILAIYINRRQETVLIPKYGLILGIELIWKHALACFKKVENSVT